MVGCLYPVPITSESVSRMRRKHGEECGCDRQGNMQTMRKMEGNEVRGRKGKEKKKTERPTVLHSASISACVYQRRAFSPGEELDNSIPQELQSLVVIDPVEVKRRWKRKKVEM